MITQLTKDYLSQQLLSNHYSYDELLGEDGHLRPFWLTFFESLNKLGQAEIEDRSRDILRLLKENGVTYNIYDDPSGLNRPWNLDLIPFLISKEEWKKVEPGLVQRANLLDLILKDIYGERNLVKQGLLPAELIYNHNGFLRQCVGIPPQSKHSLILYSADLARSANGNIWVLNDRTQAPSGYGYALENRTAMSRINPELFTDLKVRQLSAYFNDLQQSLQSIAPHDNENPRVVILTPGPSNETYFEHSYLAEKTDSVCALNDELFVEDNILYYKCYHGKEKVGAIYRRISDEFLDPLTFLSDSLIGIPNIMDVYRSGNVAIINAPGNGVADDKGIYYFVPKMIEYYLKEEAILKNAPTYLPFYENDRKYVLDHLNTLVIKDVAEAGGYGVVFGNNLSEEELLNLRHSIEAEPRRFIAQEVINFLDLPAMGGDKEVARKADLRAFVLTGSETRVWASGLTRFSRNADSFIVNSSQGGGFKDTWVLSQ